MFYLWCFWNCDTFESYQKYVKKYASIIDENKKLIERRKTVGTNFYVRGHRDDNDSKWHIGKRSAAGYYCWDCKTTLCKNGEADVHKSESEWYDKCPICGKAPIEEGWVSSSGRELRFNKTKPAPKTGVASCSSFSWAQKLGKVQKIEDEYGRKYTRKEFEQMLTECPIQHERSFGQWFC